MITAAASLFLLHAVPPLKPEVVAIQERKDTEVVRAWDVNGKATEPIRWETGAMFNDSPGQVEIIVRIPRQSPDLPQPTVRTSYIKGLQFLAAGRDAFRSGESDDYLGIVGRPRASSASMTLHVASGAYETLATGTLKGNRALLFKSGFKASACIASRKDHGTGKTFRQTLLKLDIPKGYEGWELDQALSNDKGDQLNPVFTSYRKGGVDVWFEEKPTKTMRMEILGRKTQSYSFTGIPLAPAAGA
jgi:hypothetical protein